MNSRADHLKKVQRNLEASGPKVKREHEMPTPQRGMDSTVWSIEHTNDETVPLLDEVR
jgi:hypothetical protein